MAGDLAHMPRSAGRLRETAPDRERLLAAQLPHLTQRVGWAAPISLDVAGDLVGATDAGPRGAATKAALEQAAMDNAFATAARPGSPLVDRNAPDGAKLASDLADLKRDVKAILGHLGLAATGAPAAAPS